MILKERKIITSMICTEEEILESLRAVSGVQEVVEEKSRELYPCQCDQSLLKSVMKACVKNPCLRKNKDVLYILEKIKTKKKFEEKRLTRVIELISKE
jgi:hypothetical protein